VAATFQILPPPASGVHCMTRVPPALQSS
jgi:hypothetical protein